MLKDFFWNKILLFLAMAVCVTVIEYIAGVLALKIVRVRLWDYSNEWGNIQGIICPRFFIIGFFFGVFIIDVVHSVQIIAKLKKFAEENDVVVKYEVIKSNIRSYYEGTKYRFFHPFYTDRPLSEHLKDLRDTFEKRMRKAGN